MTRGFDPLTRECEAWGGPPAGDERSIISLYLCGTAATRRRQCSRNCSSTCPPAFAAAVPQRYRDITECVCLCVSERQDTNILTHAHARTRAGLRGMGWGHLLSRQRHPVAGGGGSDANGGLLGRPSPIPRRRQLLVRFWPVILTRCFRLSLDSGNSTLTTWV